MKSNKFTPKKNAAQAIVEFAIVLPILLLLLYGLLEAGRLLFIYSSIVTASRQAVRYGATTGLGTGGVPRYQDCAGIRQAAQKVDFLNAFDNNDIYLFHDGGPSTAQVPYCAGVADTTGYTPPNTNTDRLIVKIEGDFNSLVPKIVPFISRTVAKGNPIIATSARTIIMAVEIQVAAGGGTGPADTTVTLTAVPASNAEAGQTVIFTATVTSGAGVPTGTVSFTSNGTAIGACTGLTLSAGVATCALIFPNADTTYHIEAVYTPADPNAFAPDSGFLDYQVGASTTITTITSVVAEPSLINNAVTVSVWVTNQYGGTTPTGTVAVTAASGSCNINLGGGAGSCALPGFGSTGWFSINAAYTPADATKHKPSTATYSHEVLSSPPTASNTPPPPTGIPTIATTPAPTPVTGCNSIRDTVGSIKFSSKTMTLELTNTNSYAVTVSSVFVAWNYAAGHVPGDTSLWLQKAELGSTTFWTGNINQPSALLPLSTTVVIPANSKPKLTFTFDKTYNKPSGEQIQIQFSTPGCESYPAIVPLGSPTITPAPSGNLKIQLISGGTDNNQQSQFRFQVQNNGASAISGISVRLYFTLDGTNVATDYVLEKYWDQSGAATITGPTLASGTTYYYTIDYGAASLGAGSTWEYQGALHLSSWAATYDATNDWWHTTGALPSSWTDWPTIPAYVSGSITWGSQP
jgi:hypothetical protein